MDVEEKIKELNEKKSQMEKTVGILQQQMANINRDYLILLGEIKAYEEMKQGE